MSNSPLPPSQSFFKTLPGKILAGVLILVVIAAIAFATIKRKADGSLEFSLNQKVTAQSMLRFQFPENMDQKSVEENLSVPADLTGEFSWEGSTLVFDPAQKLEEGETYEFQLNRATKRADGVALGRDLDFRFEVSGQPELVTHMPSRDARDVPETSKITLVFDRAMIPLTQVQGDAAGARMNNFPVTITPAVNGRWRWLGTTAVEFIPEKGLEPGTQYTVSVPAGIETVSGDKTEKDFTWTFETLRPAILSMTPAEGSQVAGPTTEISLTFNQEMDPEKAKGSIVLLEQASEDYYKDRDGNRAARLEKRLGTGAVAPGTKEVTRAIKTIKFGTVEIDGKQQTDKKTLVLIPAEPLQFKKTYTVRISPGLKAARGSLGTPAFETKVFHTVSDMSVESSTYYYGSMQINFSQAFDKRTLADGGITIDPPVDGWKEMEATWKEEYQCELLVDCYAETQLYLWPNLAPRTKYTLTVTTKVKDRFGQALTKPHTFTFTTDPLQPEVFINAKDEFGIFEKDKAPVYYLNGMNINAFDVAFAKLTLPEFLAMRQQKRDRWETRIDLRGKADYKEWKVPLVKKKNDAWEVIPFDLQEKLGRKLTPGIYGFTANAPEAGVSYGIGRPQVQFFALTDLAITLKHSNNKVFAWVTNMQTGESVADATVRVLALNGNEVAIGKTNPKGFFETDIDAKALSTPNNDYWRREFYVTAEKAGDIAFVGSEWADGIRPGDFGFWDEYLGPESPEFRVSQYTYTDRPIYRPGDTVHFKVVLRLRDKNGIMMNPQKDMTARVTITDAGEGKQVYVKTLPISEYGTVVDEFTVGAEAPVGNYSIATQILPEEKVGQMWEAGSFIVLEYRKPEYQVALTTEKDNYFDDEKIKATIAGSFYFGAPMDGAKVNWRAQTTDYYFNNFTDGWYSFALEDVWCYYDCSPATEQFAEGEGTLDASGRMEVTVPINLDDKGVSQVVTIEADVLDQNNQVVANRVSVPVHKSSVYVGARSDNYVVTPNQEADISIVTVDIDGKPVKSQSVKVELYSRVWNTIRKKSVDAEYYYENEPKDTFVSSSSITTGADGKAKAKVKIPTGGEFRIVVTTKDGSGRESKAGTSVYAWSSTYFNWPHTNSDRMDIEMDKPEYKPGDTAKLLIKSPYQGTGVKALVTVERENVMEKSVIDIESNAQSIEVPITEAMIPNAFVSVVIVKPRMGETFNEFGTDTGLPAFKIGYAKLKVETEKKRLTLTMKPDKERYGPGEKVTVTLTAKTADGRPAVTEMSFSAVDMSVLALTGFGLPDLVATFYTERGLGVSTAQMLMHVIERFKPGSKGGGGASPEERARGTFKDTAHWDPRVITNENGEATVAFRLPDNLTTWKMLAVAATKDHEFGAVAEEIIETKKVIVRPVRPRFTVHGDEVTLAAIVHNFLPDTQTFTVTLEGEGFTARGKMSQQVTLKTDAQQKLIFPVIINKVDSVKLRFKAVSPAGEDDITETIPAYAFGTPQSVATSGITETAKEEVVLVPTEEDASQGKLKVTVSPSLASYLPGGLEYLVQFPYGCAEQTVSSFLPNIAVKGLENFDAFQIVDDATLEKNISGGLQKIYGFQRADGGFGYWEGSELSYPYLSAYMLYALQATRDANYQVDETVISRTRSYLQAVLRKQNMEATLDLTERAYILFVLSENASSVDPALLENMWEKRKSLPIFAQAQLAMAFQNAGTENRAKDLLTEIVNAAKIDARGTHFEEAKSNYYDVFMHTNTRTTAFVLQALTRIDSTNAIIPNIVRYLLVVRENGHWDTTQSTTISLLAFAEYLRATKELDANYKTAVNINGKQVLSADFNKQNILTKQEVTKALGELLRGQENNVQLGKEGAGRLYYDILLSYFYEGDTLEPAEEGISIIREMEPLKKGDPKDVLLGGTHRVRLTITVPEDRHFVAVESPLPAGMEPIDLSLLTSQQGLLEGEANEPDKNMWGYTSWWNTHWWNHEELRDDRVFLFADHLRAGVYEYEYLIRATTPGKFKLRPARAWEMYMPETFGQTGGEWFTVKE